MQTNCAETSPAKEIGQNKSLKMFLTKLIIQQHREKIEVNY